MTGKYLPRITLVVALVSPGSALALDQPHPGFEIGLRTGHALAAGRQGVPTTGTNNHMDEFVTGQLPFWLDVGYRPTSKVYLGGFLQYGLGLVNDAQEGRYHFNLGSFSPWLGYGLGYEWWSFKVDYNLGVGTDPDFQDTWLGFEFANFQVGADFQVLRRLILAPFISFSLDQFRNFKRTLDSPAMTVKYDVADKSIHEWLFLGLRIAFTP
jgi:hypothetical protein